MMVRLSSVIARVRALLGLCGHGAQRRSLGHRRGRLGLEVLEDRTVPAGVLANYNLAQDWGSGFQGEIRLANQQSQAINDWRLEFELDARITSIWDARIVSQTGNRYVVASAGWNQTLAVNGTVAFGFVASPGHVAAPTQFVLNGVPLDGSTPAPALPTVSLADAAVQEGNTGATAMEFVATLSAPSATPVNVQYTSVNGTAQAGSDFTPVSGTLNFAPGEVRKIISVNILGDTQPESDESFTLRLSNPVGAALGKSEALGMIRDDDAPASTGNFGFSVTSDWGSGFTGQIVVRNPGTTAVADWTVEFDFRGQIGSIWDAQIVSHQGDHYVIKHAGWNSALAAGGTVSFGFTASPGNVTAGPTNYLLKGASSPTTPPPATMPPPAPVPTPAPTPAPTPLPAPRWPAQVFAPYVDMTLYPMFDLASAARNQGVKFFTLAFVVADPRGQPSWGGYEVYGVNGSEFDLKIRDQINAVRALGGDVSVSFGGAANRELAQVITDVTALKNAYQRVIDAYGLTHIDFDIEGAAAAERSSIDRRSQAIAALQRDASAAGRELEVTFTLPVLPTGLTHDGLYVLQSALRFGVDIAGVNIMAMDYGDSAAPNPDGRMGDYAIQAATSLFDQLRGLFGSARTDAQLWGMVGVTPMIGLNDVTTEVFDQQEARELLAFAEQRGLGMLSMWSLNRDRQNPAGKINYVDITSSSILQDPYEFAMLFNTFTG